LQANQISDTAGNFAAAGNIGTLQVNIGGATVTPVITLVSPDTLQPKPIPQTQLLTLSGSGFSESSRLTFSNAAGGVFSGRVPTFNSTTGQLSYNIAVGTVSQSWDVRVVNGGAVSEPFPFLVSAALPVATPTISPNGGSFTGSVQVTIATATSGATLRYTLDGTDPSASSAVYTGPLTLGTSLTLKARGFKSGMADSAVASVAFTRNTDPVGPSITSVSPTVFQPMSDVQSIRIYGSGFVPGSLLHFYDPDNNRINNAETDYDSSTRLDDFIRTHEKFGTWRVKVVNPDGRESNFASFIVEQPPPGNFPLQTFPANGATGIAPEPTLRWAPVAGASEYRVKFGEDPNVLNINYSPDFPEQRVTRADDPGKTYYWQVRAEIDGVLHAWSPTWSFTIDGELNLPPTIQNASVNPTVVTQGEIVRFDASGVSDPNLPPDAVERVVWFEETNGTPGYQPNFNQGQPDKFIAGDSDGSNGWSDTEDTYGDIPPDSLFPGTHTIWVTARDTHNLYSTPIGPLTVTVLPSNQPIPMIESFAYDPSKSTVAITYNTNVRGGLLGIVYRSGFSAFLNQYTYDSVSRTAVFTLPVLTNSDYTFVLQSGGINAAGQEVQGNKTFGFFVLAADANRDRTVDSQDYSVVLQNLNTGGGKGLADGDFNGDEVVDELDLQIVEANLGQTLPPLAGAPGTPTNGSPSDGASAAALTPILGASAFSDSDVGDSHIASQWVITRVSDSIVVFNSGEDSTNLTSIPVSLLAPGTAYSWKVRYLDNRGVWSGYSSPTTFTTLVPRIGDTDADGDVDLSDLGTLATHFGQTSGAGWADGDFDGDGDVDLNDLGALASNFETAARQPQPQANVQAATYRPRPSALPLPPVDQNDPVSAAASDNRSGLPEGVVDVELNALAAPLADADSQRQRPRPRQV
jgi:hypothetical protein